MDKIKAENKGPFTNLFGRVLEAWDQPLCHHGE